MSAFLHDIRNGFRMMVMMMIEHFMKAGRIFITFLVVSVSATIVPAQSLSEPTHHELVEKARASSGKNLPEEAAALWEKALALNPHDGRNWTQYGFVLLGLKDYGKAVKAFEKAYDLGSGYPWEQLYHIARCYSLAGDKEKGMQYLERSINEGHRNLKMIAGNGELAPLRDDPRYKKLLGSPDVAALSRDEGWRFDLHLLVREIKRLHYDPFRRVGRAAFDDFVGKLDREIPKLTDPQIVTSFMKIAAMAGDGHTVIRHPDARDEGKKMLPVQFYLFEEGLFITATAPEQADLAGAQVLRIGGQSVEKVMTALDPLISRDNSMWPKLIAPLLMRSPLILNGVGVTSDPTQVEIAIRDSTGRERTVTLAGNSGGPDEKWVLARKNAPGTEPLYLRNRRAPYWFEYLPEHKLAWLQYNAIANDRQEKFDDFCARVFKFINENDVEKLVVDLRWNGGGNTFLIRPLVHGLIANEKINKPGKLFVIVGRSTFSAAMNTSTLIERHTNAIFVGEPTGSSPNFIGETIRIELPYSRMNGSVSDLYWQTSWPMDHRPWIPPVLYTPPTFADLIKGSDPAFDAILKYRVTGGD